MATLPRNDSVSMDAVNEKSANSVFAKPASNGVPNDGTGIIQMDGYLEPFRDAIKSRYAKAQQWIKDIDSTEGGLEKFSRVRRAPIIQSRTGLTISKGYEKFGFTVSSNGDITYREWAPNALRAYLIGDFSMSPITAWDGYFMRHNADMRRWLESRLT